MKTDCLTISDTPDVAIIVPVWGQGPLLCEALSSILAQRTSARIVAYLMDDACPQPETVAVCRRFARAHPDIFRYWRSPENRGLAAMRNEGAALALSDHPDLFSILSFDGDDRLHPDFIDRALTALRAAIAEAPQGQPRPGWVFEDPDHFGQDGVMLRTHRYSALWSMAGCANCPTSLASADIYRAGLRFREDMKHGSEDWQFWLSCLAAGFRGVYVPHMGFRYRRRPGSMSVGALDLAASNKVDIRLSRRDIFNPDFYLTEEADELPRYLTVDAGGHCRIRRHPADPGTPLTRRDYVTMLEELARLPTAALPQFAVFADPGLLDVLTHARCLGDTFRRLELAARADGFAALALGQGGPVIRCLSSEHLLKLCRGGVDQAKLAGAEPPILDLPADTSIPRYQTATAFLSFLLACRRDFRSPGTAPRRDMTTWKPFGLSHLDLPRDFFGVPMLVTGERLDEATAIVADAATLADPAHAAAIIALAKGLFRPPTLAVLGDGLDLPDHDVFADIHILAPTGQPARDDAILAGLLAPFGILIDAGSLKAVPVLNQLRGHGRRTVAALCAGPGAGTPLGAHLDTCFKVFDAVIAPTGREATICRALGVADEQIATGLAA